MSLPLQMAPLTPFRILATLAVMGVMPTRPVAPAQGPSSPASAPSASEETDGPATVQPFLEGKALYIAFCGYYPVLKSALEIRRLPRLAEWGIKLAIFNVAVIAAYFLMLTVFGIPADSLTIGGVSLPWVFLLLGNAVFFVYDWCLTGLISKYMTAWQPRVRQLFKF